MSWTPIRGLAGVGLAMLLLLALIPAASMGHAERATFYPDRGEGAVPKIRKKGPTLVVCKRDSGKRIRRSWPGRNRKGKRIRRQRLKQLKRCRFKHIRGR